MSHEECYWSAVCACIAMRVSYLLVSISCLSYRHAGCSATDDYADPLDMLNYDRATKTMQKATARTSGESARNDDRCRVFLPRFVNMLLKNTGISVSIYESTLGRLGSDKRSFIRFWRCVRLGFQPSVQQWEQLTGQVIRFSGAQCWRSTFVGDDDRYERNRLFRNRSDIEQYVYRRKKIVFWISKNKLLRGNLPGNGVFISYQL